MPNLLKVLEFSIQSEFFLCCRSKVCSDAFVKINSPSFLQHVCMLKSSCVTADWLQTVYSDCIL